MSRKRMLLLSSLLVLGMTVVGCSTDATNEKAFSNSKREVLQESIGKTTENTFLRKQKKYYRVLK